MPFSGEPWKFAGMDLSLFLTLTVMSLSALQIVMLLVYRVEKAVGVFLVNALVLAVGGLALAFRPEWAAASVTILYIPFVLVPSLLMAQAQRLVNMGRVDTAARLALWAARFHPSTGNRVLADLYRAFAVKDVEASAAALEAIAARVPARRRPMLEALAAIRRADWDKVLRVVEQAPENDASIKSIAVRALGEAGRIDDLARFYERAKSMLHGYELLHAQLFVLAFCGRARAVAGMLANQLRSTGPEIKEYWMGVAELHAADGSPRSSHRLEQLSRAAESPSMRLAASRHIARVHADAPLTPSVDGRRTVMAIEKRVVEEAPLTHFNVRGMRGTLALVALVSAVFAIELYTGSSENTRNLVRLGALWPPYVVEDGQWWRLVTATLLHAGWMHFIANTLALFVFARLIETMIGLRWLLATFFLGGLLSSATVLVAMYTGLTGFGVLVGASGAIFALVGIETARQIVAWWRTGDILDRRRVLLLAVIIVIQLAIDLSIPGISVTAHISGFIVGLLLGFVRAAATGRPRDAISTPSPQ